MRMYHIGWITCVCVCPFQSLLVASEFSATVPYTTSVSMEPSRCWGIGNRSGFPMTPWRARWIWACCRGVAIVSMWAFWSPITTFNCLSIIWWHCLFSMGTMQHVKKKITIRTIAALMAAFAKMAPHWPKIWDNPSKDRPPLPAFSCTSPLSFSSLPIAAEKLPSCAVLLGMYVQQYFPNILHTPPFSAKIQSNICLFCHATRLVACSCLPTAYRTSMV